MIDGAVKDVQTVTPEGERLVELIDGVVVKESTNIVTRSGVTTELFRPDWNIGLDAIKHAIRVSLRSGAISAWHCHELQNDHIFVIQGTCNVVLYDDRSDSPTRKMLNQFHLSHLRPSLVRIPPGIWHGIQNMEHGPSAFINYFDRPYCYKDPDEWRLPADTEKIPYRFTI